MCLRRCVLVVFTVCAGACGRVRAGGSGVCRGLCRSVLRLAACGLHGKIKAAGGVSFCRGWLAVSAVAGWAARGLWLCPCAGGLGVWGGFVALGGWHALGRGRSLVAGFRLFRRRLRQNLRHLPLCLRRLRGAPFMSCRACGLLLYLFKL